MNTHPPLSASEIARFHLPLVLTAQMMTLSVPLINLGLGRLDEPALALAGYAVGFSISVILNSPVLPARALTAALVRDRASWLAVRAFVLVLGWSLAILEALIALTPAGGFLLESIMGIPSEVAWQARITLLIHSPIPVFLAIRGLDQGLALIYKKPGLITASTLARLVALTGIVLGLVVVLRLPGAAAGALALTTGVGMEAFMIRAPVRRRFASFSTPPPVASLPERVTPRRILKFVFPLMLNQAAWSSQRAVINAAISRLDDPFLALASFGVVHPLFFFMDSPLFSLQSVVQVLSRTRRDLARLAAYTVTVSTSLGIIATVLAFNWGRAILTSGYGLDLRLAQEALPALLWIGLAPVLSGLRAYGQGILLRTGRTGPLTVSSVLRVVMVGVAGFLLVALLPGSNGALLGAWLILLGDGCDVGVALGWGLTHLEGMGDAGATAPEAGESATPVRG